jgi:hypothetical protein
MSCLTYNWACSFWRYIFCYYEFNYKTSHFLLKNRSLRAFLVETLYRSNSSMRVSIPFNWPKLWKASFTLSAFELLAEYFINILCRGNLEELKLMYLVLCYYLDYSVKVRFAFNSSIIGDINYLTNKSFSDKDWYDHEEYWFPAGLDYVKTMFVKSSVSLTKMSNYSKSVIYISWENIT